MSRELYQKVSAERVCENGDSCQVDISILEEHSIEVYINEIPSIMLVCTDTYIRELIVGRLISEGIISSVEDIKSIYLCDEDDSARVYLSDGIELRQMVSVS